MKWTIMVFCLSALFISAVCPMANVSGADEDLRTKVEKMEEMLKDLKGQLKKQAISDKELQTMKEQIKGITMPSDDL